MLKLLKSFFDKISSSQLTTLLMYMARQFELFPEFIASLPVAGQSGSLKTRSDGTIVDGHHRIKILRDRGVDVDSLPREVIAKSPIPDAME